MSAGRVVRGLPWIAVVVALLVIELIGGFLVFWWIVGERSDPGVLRPEVFVTAPDSLARDSGRWAAVGVVLLLVAGLGLARLVQVGRLASWAALTSFVLTAVSTVLLAVIARALTYETDGANIGGVLVPVVAGIPCVICLAAALAVAVSDLILASDRSPSLTR